MSALIGDVALDHVNQRVHPLGELRQRRLQSIEASVSPLGVLVGPLGKFGQRGLQPFEASVSPLGVFLQPIQALISPLGKQPSAFREFPQQPFHVREVTRQPSDVGVS